MLQILNFHTQQCKLARQQQSENSMEETNPLFLDDPEQLLGTTIIYTSIQ